MKKLKFLPALGALGLAASAHAELPSAVSTAITSAQTDATTAAWLVVGVIAAIFGVKLVLRVIR